MSRKTQRNVIPADPVERIEEFLKAVERARVAYGVEALVLAAAMPNNGPWRTRWASATPADLTTQTRLFIELDAGWRENARLLRK